MSKKRTAWTVAIQRGAASHWKLALGCAACAWLVARFIQARSASGTDPAEERRLASERADYFERKAQAVKAARPARRPGSGEGEACPAAPAQPVRAEDLVSPPRYVPPAESAAETSISPRPEAVDGIQSPSLEYKDPFFLVKSSVTGMRIVYRSFLFL